MGKNKGHNLGSSLLYLTKHPIEFLASCIAQAMYSLQLHPRIGAGILANEDKMWHHWVIVSIKTNGKKQKSWALTWNASQLHGTPWGREWIGSCNPREITLHAWCDFLWSSHPEQKEKELSTAQNMSRGGSLSCSLPPCCYLVSHQGALM